MLTPYKKPPKKELPPQKRRFNYLHSVTRGPVERGLGVDKGRFRWMLRGIQLRSVYSYVAWFEASCILHNMCIDTTGAADVIDAEDGDDRFHGLVSKFDSDAAAYSEPGDKAFTAAISAALAKRTELALQQASFGLKIPGKKGRRASGKDAGATVSGASASASAAAAALMLEDEDVPEDTCEQDDVDPSLPASALMIDTSEGEILRDVVFSGLGIVPLALSNSASGQKRQRAAAS